MIRHATQNDIADITRIYNEAITEGGFTGDLVPVSTESRLNWFADHNDGYVVFVKEIDSLVVGYIALSPYRKGRQAFCKTCEISYYLSIEYRGVGIGKELFQHAQNYARESGFKVVVAILLGCNTRSMNLLQRFDFSESGRLRMAAYINGEYIDHVYMVHYFD